MRKLNLPWLAGIVIGTIVLAAMTYGLHEFQMARNASAYVREAKRAQAENRPKVAAEHLGRYVKLAPHDNDGLILYGFQLADIGKDRAAYFTLEKALRQAPDNAEVRRRLVPLAMRLGSFSDAEDHLKNHLLEKSPDDAELLQQLSECYMGRGKYELAEEPLQKAIASDPHRLQPYLRLAYLWHQKLNRPREAVKLLNQMVSANSSDYHVYLYRAQWQIQRLVDLKEALSVNRVSHEKYDQEIVALREGSEADAAEALKRAPDDVEAIYLAAHIAQEANRRDDLRKYAEKGIELHPVDARFYSLLAQLTSSNGDIPGAIAILQRGIAARSGRPEKSTDADLNWILANLLIDVENYGEVPAVLKQLRVLEFPSPLITYLEARVLFRRNEWLALIKDHNNLPSALHKHPDLEKQVDLWLALAYRETGSRDEQLISYRRAVALDAEFVPARLGLAEALVSSNQINEAVDEYQKIFSKPGAPIAAGVGLAKSLLLLNLRKAPADQSWDEFDDVMRRIDEREGTSTSTAILRMEKCIVQKDLKEAATVIAAAREQNLDQKELWIAQISLAQRDRNWDLVEQLIEGAEQQLGDIVPLRMIRGRYLVQRHGAEAKDSLEKLDDPRESWTKEQRIELAAAFGPLFAAVKEYDQALRQIAVVSQAMPKNLQIRLLQLDIAMLARRPALMEETLETIREIFGKGPIWHYGEAVRLNLVSIDKNDEKTAKEALSHLDQARESRRSWEKIPLLSAEIYERLGEKRVACDQYLEAIRLGERSPAVTTRTFSLLFLEQRFDDAEKLFKHLRESQSLFTDGMVRAEVDLSLQMNHPEQALKAVEQLVRNSTQGEDPVWLGRVFATLGKYDVAEEHFRNAVKINGTAPQPWIGLVQVLMLSKQQDQAELVIAEAKSAIAPDQAMLAIGQCYEILAAYQVPGSIELARTSYQSALDQSPNDSKTNRIWVEFLLKSGTVVESEAALRKLLKDALGTDEERQSNQQWAHRRLAATLMLRGGRAQLSEALTLIEKNLDLNPKSSEDRRLEARILALGSSSDQRLKATKILVDLLANEPPGAVADEDRFTLSRLYTAAGDRTKARAELRTLIATQKVDHRYLAAYAQFCLQADETNEAELYLDKLQKLAPNELSTSDLAANVLFAKRKYSEVVDAIKKAVGKFSQPSKVDLTVTVNVWAARRCEDYSRRVVLDKRLTPEQKNSESARFVSESEVYYTKIVEIRPEESLTLAEFLGTTTKIDKALDLLQNEGPRASPLRNGIVAVSIMKNPRVTTQQLTRLQSLLKPSSESADPTLVLDLTYADLLAWRGKSREATDCYREILRRDENNIAALNNLAYVNAVTGGDLQEALKSVTKALDKGGPLDALLDTRGLIHLAAGTVDKAIVDFEQSLNQHETAERRFHFALAFAQLNQLTLAKDAFDKAIEKGFSDSESHPLERAMLQRLRDQLKSVEKAK